MFCKNKRTKRKQKLENCENKRKRKYSVVLILKGQKITHRLNMKSNNKIESKSICVCLVRVSHFLSLSFFLSLFTWFSLFGVALHSTPNRAKKIKRKKILRKKSKNNWEYCTRELTETCKVEGTVNNGCHSESNNFISVGIALSKPPSPSSLQASRHLPTIF